MDNFDPMQSTLDERKHALMVVLWSLTIVKNHTNDDKLLRAVARAETALGVTGPHLTSEMWPPKCDH
jgi:hypothetical protein